MAIEKEKILEIFESEAEAGAKADSLLDLIKEETQAELNAVLVNKEQILAEKREESAKRKAVEEQLKAQKEQVEKLTKQLEASSPEEVKKHYEQTLMDAENIHQREVSDYKEQISKKEKYISELELYRLRTECMEEFNKAIVGKNVEVDSIDDLAYRVLGENCCKFSHRPIGEGREILATKEGLSIKQAVDATLETSFGKRCIRMNSSGGGAEGGTKNFSSVNNPFITGNITEQMRLYRENPNLYAQLKAVAAVK